MKVVVCVKQVAVLGDEIEFTPDERDVDPDYVDRALNEWDAAATEEALQIRERLGEGEVVVVSAGEGEADPALRRCLAMGADRAGGGEPAYRVRRMFSPPKGKGAEILKGSPAEIAARISEIIKERLR